MTGCAALCKSPELRRVGVATTVLVLMQAAGLLAGPLLLSWRVNLLWGGRDDLKLFGSLMLATLIGSLAVTLWMNRRARASTGERIFVISSSVYVLPGLVCVYYALAGFAYGRWDGICWGLLIAGWIAAPILFSLPMAHVSAWGIQLVIDRIRGNP